MSPDHADRPVIDLAPSAPRLLAGVLGLAWAAAAIAAAPAPGTGLTAAPPAIASFTINGGAATTPERSVNLAWTLTGPAATHFRVSESASFPNQSWNTMPLALPWRWSIPSAGEGSKTVHVQFMNNHGQSEVGSATIELRIPPAVTSIAIENGAAATARHRVNVRWQTSGIFTHYRVGRAGYDSLPWVAASAPPAGGVDVELISASTADQRNETIYVQLKRDNDAAVTVQQSIRFEPPLVDVTLDRLQASSLMKADGVASRLLGGQGGCRTRTETFDGLTYLVAAADGSLTGPRCGFTLFPVRKLQGRWTLKAVDLHLGLWLPPGMVALGDKKKPASTCRFIAGPALGTNNMAMGVEVLHPGDGVAPGDTDVETYCLLSRIVLNGPKDSGTSW
ncbi:MAG TPA: hypothetical protein PKD25_14450 [Rubrivivax sp.]|nr:hypothetical protein [Rubrivivax sp.]